MVVDEEEALLHETSRALLYAYVVGINLAYTGDSYLHLVRLRLEDINVACRGAPAHLPLLHLGTSPLPPPAYSVTTPDRSLDVSLSRSASQSFRRNDSIGSVRSSMDHREPSMFPSGDSSNMGVELLLRLSLDPDPKITGRPFQALQSDIRLATIACHVDQVTVAELITVGQYAVPPSPF